VKILFKRKGLRADKKKKNPREYRRIVMGKGCLIKGWFILFATMIFGLTMAWAEEKDIVAKIGQRVITTAEFEQLLHKRAGNRPVDKQTKEGLLNNLVQTIALGDAARKKGLDKRKDIQEMLELAQDNILANELVKEEVISKVKIDEAQARKYYEKNPARFKSPEQARVRQIMINGNATLPEADRKKAREKAEAILTKIKGGGDFAKLAEEFSEDQATKAKGGDMGFLSKSPQPHPFEKAAFALKPGEVSDVVETPFGYVLIKMEEKKKEEIQPFESVKDRVMNMALEEAKKEKTKEFVDQVMKEAEVKIYPAGLEEVKR
jgi:peptidyl-prolyl cis-trans isomerase C